MAKGKGYGAGRGAAMKRAGIGSVRAMRARTNRPRANEIFKFGQRKRNPYKRGTPRATAWNRRYNRQRSAAGGGGGS